MKHTLIFIETIRILNQKVISLSYHQQRVDKTLSDHNLPPLNIKQLLSSLPQDIPSSLCRCRITYGQTPTKIDYFPYTPLVRQRVKIVRQDNLSYSYKYADRRQIEELVSLSTCEDIIIVKNDKITDSSIANLVFENKEGLFTPTTPLLKGTQRQRLIDKGVISLRDITLKDIKTYDKLYFINAMTPLNSTPAFLITDLEY